jgi:CRISPR-associated protein Csy2
MGMNQDNITLLVLRKVEVESANAVSGLTYGYPAISNFLGFTHALSRKLETTFQLKLGRCAVISHEHQIHAYRPNKWDDFSFSLTRNPLTKEEKPAPFVEEGRMHLTVTLVIECLFDEEDDAFFEAFDSSAEFIEQIKQVVFTQRLAGGTITAVEKIEFNPEVNRKWFYQLLPGFALVERSDLLAEHAASLHSDQPEATLLDAWLDFSALKYKAEPVLEEGETLNDSTKAHWHYCPKPAPGWLVPITTGYRAISEVYQPGEVSNTRDETTPFCFVEAAYTIGQWLSPHRVNDIKDLLWKYSSLPEQGWYLCKNDYANSIEK